MCIRDSNESVSKPDFVPLGKEITTSYEEGQSVQVPLHDGSLISLEKLSKDFDPSNKASSLAKINKAEEEGKVLTGLLYINTESKDLKETLNVVDKPLNQLNERDLCPGAEKLQAINKDLC